MIIKNSMRNDSLEVFKNKKKTKKIIKKKIIPSEEEE